MTQQTMHPLAEQYLEDLRRATSTLPRAQQAELIADLRSHLEAGLALAETEADVRNLLESLGTPESVVAALDVAPADASRTRTPLLLGLFSVATFLPGMAALWIPPVAILSGALGLAAVWTGVRAMRRTHRAWQATVGTLLGAATVLFLIVSWTMLIAVNGRSQLTHVGPTEVTMPLVAITDLQLRPVLTENYATTGQCPMTTPETSPSEEVTACSADGMYIYSLGPASVTGRNVENMNTFPGSSAKESIIEIMLDGEGAGALAAMSQQLLGQVSPKSKLAIVIRGEVQTAPTVMDAFTTGKLQVSVPLSAVQAQVLVDGIYSRTQ